MATTCFKSAELFNLLDSHQPPFCKEEVITSHVKVLSSDRAEKSPTEPKGLQASSQTESNKMVIDKPKFKIKIGFMLAALRSYGCQLSLFSNSKLYFTSLWMLVRLNSNFVYYLLVLRIYV